MVGGHGRSIIFQYRFSIEVGRGSNVEHEVSVAVFYEVFSEIIE